jgi:hypothetical protein
MLLSQADNWRTDLIIYSLNFPKEFHSLGCVNRLRSDKLELSRCRLLLYIPIKDRTSEATKDDFRTLSRDFIQAISTFQSPDDIPVGIPDLKNTMTYNQTRSQILFTELKAYGYTDSINVMYEGYENLKMYDFVMRTDIGK